MKFFQFCLLETIHIFCIAVGSSCAVAGWGATETSASSDKLLWAKVLIRNTTECRVENFITLLKHDLHDLTDLTVLLVKRPVIKTPSF